MGAPVVHFEIGCKDSEKTGAFYREMFGWDTHQHGPATMINTGAGRGIQGHITSLGHDPHHYVTVYVEVPDLTVALAKAESLGGKTVVPPVDVPGQGAFAWFTDLDGNVVGLWKAAVK